MENLKVNEIKESVTEICEGDTCEAPNPNYAEPTKIEELPMHVQLDIERERHYREQTKTERLDFLALELMKINDTNLNSLRKVAAEYLESRFAK